MLNIFHRKSGKKIINNLFFGGSSLIDRKPVKNKEGMGFDVLRERELIAMHNRFPLLSVLDGLNEADINVLYKEACNLIALSYEPAREAALRTELKQIGTNEALRQIAFSDIREGIPYSTNVRAFPDLWELAREQVIEHEREYGGAVFTQEWPSLSRGRVVTYYFKHHKPVGSVLHIAPEKELEQWMRENVENYQTLGLGASNDMAEDLTNLPIQDNSYDIVICHRVMEHIFDETAALVEIKRILCPGGFFNVSVPESMHLPGTLDWCYPDASHHNHYRQYGSDFATRVERAGFRVELVRWSLEQSREELKNAGTYPFRMYNAYV